MIHLHSTSPEVDHSSNKWFWRLSTINIRRMTFIHWDLQFTIHTWTTKENWTFLSLQYALVLPISSLGKLQNSALFSKPAISTQLKLTVNSAFFEIFHILYLFTFLYLFSLFLFSAFGAQLSCLSPTHFAAFLSFSPWVN